MKKLLFVIGAVLLGLCLVVGVIWAVEVEREAAMFWDDPAFDQGYELFPIAPAVSYTLYIDLEIRGGGLVLASQTLVSDCEASTELSTGQCGSLLSWVWETDDWASYGFPKVSEYVRPHWIPDPTGFSPEVYGIYVPADCELEEDSCEVTFIDIGGNVLMPTLNSECMTALAFCGTGQDENGFWFVGTIPETDSLYLPVIMKGM